jgi:hypothetical protein
MQMIKKASLEFYHDVGFVPDNVSLLIYPFEQCDVNESNWNDPDSTETCKNMIAFIDRHYKFDDTVIRDTSYVGDNGNGTYRKSKLIEIIQEKLDPKRGGWRGGYLGGNGFLKTKNIKRLGDDGTETRYEDENRYYFSDRDIRLYYDGFESGHTLSVVGDWDRDKANSQLYPLYSADFNGSQNINTGSGTYIQMDAWYENAKYREEMTGALTVLDSFGTPFEIQIPTKQALVDAGISSARTKYARIVSFGKDRRRDTGINTLDIDYSKKGYDDSVLYLFDVSDANLTSYFHSRDKE